MAARATARNANRPYKWAVWARSGSRYDEIDLTYTKKEAQGLAASYRRRGFPAIVAPRGESPGDVMIGIEAERRLGMRNPHFRGKLGTGTRFDNCVRKMRKQAGVYDPEGLCASMGRRKYGAKRMARMAKRGRGRNPGGYVNLIGVGDVPAIPAKDVKPGMVLMYNYGYTYEVVSADRKGKSVYFVIRSKDGSLYKRRKGADTLTALGFGRQNPAMATAAAAAIGAGVGASYGADLIEKAKEVARGARELGKGMKDAAQQRGNPLFWHQPVLPAPAKIKSFHKIAHAAKSGKVGSIKVTPASARAVMEAWEGMDGPDQHKYVRMPVRKMVLMAPFYGQAMRRQFPNPKRGQTRWGVILEPGGRIPVYVERNTKAAAYRYADKWIDSGQYVAARIFQEKWGEAGVWAPVLGTGEFYQGRKSRRNPESSAASPQLRIVKARYAKGKVAFYPTDSREGLKGRSSDLASILGAKWSNRERAYIMSPAKAAKLQALYDKGYGATPWSLHDAEFQTVPLSSVGIRRKINPESSAANPGLFLSTGRWIGGRDLLSAQARWDGEKYPPGWVVDIVLVDGTEHSIVPGPSIDEYKKKASKRKIVEETLRWEGLRLVKGKRNPESSAASLSESFHGVPASTVTEIHSSSHVHEWLAELGALTELIVKTVSGYNAVISFTPTGSKQVLLASSEDGSQLFLEGGDQSLPLTKLHLNSKKWLRDSMVIGAITKITYRTRKKMHDLATIDYYHKAGEDTKVKPTLIYDSISKSLSISGGQYRVEDRGIIN